MTRETTIQRPIDTWPPDDGATRVELKNAYSHLSLLLRHAPETVGLTVNSAGWANVDELIRRCVHSAVPLTRKLIGEVLAHHPTCAFELSADSRHIRAKGGHSVPVDVGLLVSIPPTTMYHGTATRFLASIRSHGLVPRHTKHLYVSPIREIALAIAARHGDPVALRLDVNELVRDGFNFYVTAQDEWMTSHVPPRYIDFGHAERAEARQRPTLG